ncbi:MAG: hypothetical protein FWD97_04655 [Defluviitaleaceae bacterium]|nr:hypothetical protein [Defluviitaleaceae bacterium]
MELFAITLLTPLHTTHLLDKHTMVGAGIARPTYTDDTVQPQRIVPTEMGRAMPAPTK